MPRIAKAKSPESSNSTATIGFEADFGPPANAGPSTFRRDLHPDLRADYVLANPPFNDSDWFRKDDDVRWQPSGARSTGTIGVFDRSDVSRKGSLPIRLEPRYEARRLQHILVNGRHRE